MGVSPGKFVEQLLASLKHLGENDRKDELAPFLYEAPRKLRAKLDALDAYEKKKKHSTK